METSAAQRAFIGAVIQGAVWAVWEVGEDRVGFMGYQMCVGCGKVKVIRIEAHREWVWRTNLLGCRR